MKRHHVAPVVALCTLFGACMGGLDLPYEPPDEDAGIVTPDAPPLVHQDSAGPAPDQGTGTSAPDAKAAKDSQSVDTKPPDPPPPCGGTCDDGNACTIDNCVNNKCVHKRKLPNSCNNNGKVDNCEVCEPTEELLLRANGHCAYDACRTLCMNCRYYGAKVRMDSIGSFYWESSYFKIQGDQTTMHITCKQGMVIKSIMGYCEDGGGLPSFVSGSIDATQGSLRCNFDGGTNSSSYDFYCGWPGT